MLPSPVSVSKRRTFRRITSPRKRILDTLLTRSRATNLAVLLLICLSVILLVFNFQLYIASFRTGPSRRNSASSLFSTINRHNDKLASLNHLVVVPCHAIWQGVDATSKLNEDDWILEPYQKGSKRIAAFFDHIVQGTKIVVDDPRSLLIFSGGQTRPSSPTTEAESYLRLALSANLLSAPTSESAFERTTTENHALDSYQNLLFSVARFREYAGHFPEHITIVGYEFKRARFTELHRKAIRWPSNKFRYIGVDTADAHSLAAHEGERQNGYRPYSVDLYGCHSFLLSKRRQRNPFSRFHAYYISSPELASLFDWCPDSDNQSQNLFKGTLPWDRPR